MGGVFFGRLSRRRNRRTSTASVTAKPLQLRLDVAADGAYRLDDRPLSLADLRQRLEEAGIADPHAVLSVETASEADYQAVVVALAAARNGGLSYISIR